jgi:nitrite reductase (NADH) small subunit/3-phenylpropionate/trans-cinnamate dioxygenase ferredoxin subunit
VSDFTTVCKVGDIAEGRARAFAVNGRMVAVFRQHGSFYAIDDICPHMGASLSGGYVQNGIVTCPWHAWRFRLDDGAWADVPKIKIGCYPVRVEGDDLQVQA